MRKWWPLVAVCLGAFMLLVDVTIVVVALPDMGRGLDASFADLQWVMDAYALALAALLLAAGSLADRFGRRGTYLASLVIFAVASLACGLAPDAGTLIAGRAVQGVGGAAMFATTMALLNLAYQGRDRAVAFGVWGAVTGAAAATGPVLGGLLTEHLSWRAIFLVNLPVSVVTIALAATVLTESRDPRARRTDLPGLVTFTLSAGSLTYALIRAGDGGWTAPVTLAWFAAGAVTLAAFVAVERRSRYPMLDLALFRRPAFTGVMLAAALVSVAAFAYFVYTSMWLQSTLGLGPVRAGLALLPMSGAAFVTSAVTARRLHDVSPRLTVGLGLALVGAGALLQSTVDGDASWTAITLGLVVAGAGVGICLPSLTAAAMAAAPAERAGMAAGALNTARQLGLALGIAALGTAFASRVEAWNLADRAAAASGLSLTMAIAGAVGLAGAGLVIPLLRTRREPASTGDYRHLDEKSPERLSS
ncbi:MFS transporter [Phytohabitans flavus]|uniref:MFS transporter n=1 Tax=Phytohabitans flavus TaxID=1076124 RepID=A0A6F8XIT7_9ACTN|nr:MFS transporter [Phytohabitans flavus]BCB73725.1 MFS transporter [Phytohabitans flavus]